MSNFECPVVKIERVVPHPGADRLDLVYFRDFAVISQRGLRSVGDLVVYCPQDSIIPEYLLKQGFYRYDVTVDLDPAFSKNPVTIPEHSQALQMLPPTLDLSIPGTVHTLDNGIRFTVLSTGKGMLAGSKGDRVKPVKLRGVLSEGIMFPVDRDYVHDETNPEYEEACDIIYNDEGFTCVKEGDNVADFLKIVKYEPVLPPSMSGDSVYIGTSTIPHFDVENIKKYPDIIQPDWEVIVTEKLHGTFFGVGYVPGLNHPDLWHGDFFCYSKGQGNRGIVFKNTEANQSNLYVRQFLKLLAPLKEIADRTVGNGFTPSPKFFMGEIFGQGVQDLNYNLKEADFRLFDVYSAGQYADWDDVVHTARHLRVSTVPVLYRGPYAEYDRELKNGNSTLAKHVREGAVIKPTHTCRHKTLGRIILKDINERYLTRKGGTEYN